MGMTAFVMCWYEKSNVQKFPNFYLTTAENTPKWCNDDRRVYNKLMKYSSGLF